MFTPFILLSESLNVLERNYDGTLNFQIKKLIATSENNLVTRHELYDNIKELFSGEDEVVLFYFSGHGYIESNQGYLVPSDMKATCDCIKMDDIMQMCNNSKAKNKIIILDCCFAGSMGDNPYLSPQVILNEGVTILSACSRNQYSIESNGHGLFTELLVDALNGSAADILGQITPGSIYAHIDQSLGAWNQRPVFKTNVQQFISLRQANPSVDISELVQITDIFKHPAEEYKLDASYEPTSDIKDEINVGIFKILQHMESVNLVIPVDEEHMYYAAINEKSCKLTSKGVHYWNLVKNKRI